MRSYRMPTEKSSTMTKGNHHKSKKDVLKASQVARDIDTIKMLRYLPFTPLWNDLRAGGEIK